MPVTVLRHTAAGQKESPPGGGLSGPFVRVASIAANDVRAQGLSRIHWAAHSSERRCSRAPVVMVQTRAPVAKPSGTMARKMLIMGWVTGWENGAPDIDAAAQHN